MKVILQKDVAKLGRRFSVVEVPDGYGFNKLIPQGLAVPATPENLKKVESQKSKAAEHQAADATAFGDSAANVAGKIFDVVAPGNADGKLYQALKPELIVAAIAAEAGVTFRPEDLVISESIKHTGEHSITVTHGAQTAAFTINVVVQ